VVFTTIDSYGVNVVADRYRHAAYHNKHSASDQAVPTSMTLNDFEPLK